MRAANLRVSLKRRSCADKKFSSVGTFPRRRPGRFFAGAGNERPRATIHTTGRATAHATRGSGGGAAGRQGARGQRRILCAQGKPAEGIEAGLHRRKIHGAWKMDGWLGDTAATDSWVRLVHRATGLAWRDSGYRGRYQLLHRKLSGTVFAGSVRSGKRAVQE